MLTVSRSLPTHPHPAKPQRPGTAFWKMLLLAVALLPATAWAQLDSLVSPGDLSKAHAKLAGVKNCNACHGPDQNVLEAKCLDCHKELAARIRDGKGFHADKKTQCTTCHSEHLGKDYDLRQLDLKQFDHAQTGWPLQGLHAKVVNCAACHKTRSFIGLKTECAACHKDPHLGRLPDCTGCHALDRPMKTVTFDHSKTAYPLTGGHVKAACMQCHAKQVYKGLPYANCNSCHTDPHKGTLGTACTTCHTTQTWKKPTVAHKAFPLTGKHLSVACEKCHPSGQWKYKKSFARCADCHKDPHLGQFPNKTCDACHSVEGFKPAKFSHDMFKLEAGHAIECVKCHAREKGSFPGGRGEAIRYKPIATTCVTCHKDIHKGQFGNQCEKCHNVQSFKLSSFDHSKTRFPLDKVHAKVACADCHKKDSKTGMVLYKPLEITCNSCHAKAHLGQLSNNCEQCHKPDGVHFDHSTSKFPLTGKHVPVLCEKCHKLEKGKFPMGAGETIRYKPIATECAACHVDEHRGQFKQDCVACHDTKAWKPSLFNHQRSSFPLDGAHRRTECAKCHKLELFETPPPPVQRVRYHPIDHACAKCHQDPHAGKMGDDCTSCHTTEEWKIVSRAFHKVGKFPLDGAHLTVRCESCHLNGVIKGTPTRCHDCHWIRRQDDLYRTQLGMDCGKCHTTVTWTGAAFNHAADAHVPLNAAHTSLSCDSCHKSGNFQPGEVQCYSCHREDYDNTTSPNHRTAGFPTTCEACHKPGDNTWQGPAFNHNSVFPLVGKHRTIVCGDCHKNGVYQGTPRNCYGCHKQDYDKTTSPNHVSAGFPTTCESCHSASAPSWGQGGFDHDSLFPLVGLHKTAPCLSCHKNGQYKGTPRECYGCHKSDYDGSKNPNHVQAGFPTTCQNCHRPSDPNWNSAFDHNQVFALVGQHRTLQCSQCHINNVYGGTPRTCYGCHRSAYEATRNPNHVQAGFPTDCQNCHKGSDPNWHTSFNHDRFFPLVGQHKTAQCASCHKNGQYKGTPRQCYGCHKPDYDATKNPNHVAAGFSTTCDSCHRASDPTWNTTFDHNKVYPLLGQHKTAQCASCHKNGQYKGTPRDCYACHKQDYDATKNPNHVSAGFPTSCEGCHKASDANWNQAKFNHNNFFPLAGKHATVPCASCHKNGQYKGTPRDCYGCHRSDYDGARDPNHVQAGFPTTCDNCHRYTDASWNQGVFNHNQFFVLAGRHATIPCDSCHKNGQYKGTPRDCYGCHRTDYEGTRDPNHIAAGFPTTCESCHRYTDASWDQGVFSHTWFPITSGRHAGISCATCHINPGNYAVFTCMNGGCHPKGETDGHHDEVGGYVYDANACYSCHPNGTGDD